jgi:hypothetical protein
MFAVDLGSAVRISKIVMHLPPLPVWWARTQTLSISGSNNGTAYTPIVSSRGYTFNPATGNTAAVTFRPVTIRFVTLAFTANTGWPAAQLSELRIYPNGC